MSRSLGLVLLIASLLISGSANAQTVDDFRVWGNVTAVTQLDALHPRLQRFYGWFEGQGRFRDGLDALDQGMARTGLGYELTDHTSLWLGYAYIPTRPRGQETLDEHRLWQQLLWTDQAGPVTVTSRTRLEQRFIETEPATGWRFREFIRFAWPPLLAYGIAKEHPEYPEALRTLSLVGWNEIFLRLNSTRHYASGLDQNRAFLGIGSKLNQYTRVEIGYLNQFIDSSPNNQMNHILSLNLFLNF